jgi:hypothetical protein
MVNCEFLKCFKSLLGIHLETVSSSVSVDVQSAYSVRTILRSSQIMSHVP